MPKRIGAATSGPTVPPITRTEIERAQQNTNSNMAAARFLNVGYDRYKRYAKIYGLFDSHLNQKGYGTQKGYAARPSSVKLKDIFANKYPTYNMSRLKNRMVAQNLILEECDLCGFKEKRITDSKTPLVLTFRNGQRDFAQDNLQLLCYNCIFLTSGAPTVANRSVSTIVKSFNDPDAIPKNWQVDLRPADFKEQNTEEPDNRVEDFSGIQEEILKELGRD